MELEEPYGMKVIVMQADGGNEEDVKNIVRRTVDTFGRIDVLINCAQASKSGLTLVQHTKEDFDLAIYSGLYATFFFMRECYPYLRATQGSVINFASGAGLSGKPNQSSYAAAKEGFGRVCVFLGSPDAKYISGETFTIQGGAGLRP